MVQKKQEEPHKVSRQIGDLTDAFAGLREKNGPEALPPGVVVQEIPIGVPAPFDVDEFIRDWFIPSFEIFEGKPFDGKANGGEPIKFLKTIIYYLLRDDRFLRSPLIARGSQYPEPSLSKGLFIIGGYGSGKTSIMRTLYKIIERGETEPFPVVKTAGGGINTLRKFGLRFGFYTSNQVKLNFETCRKDEESEFWSRHKGGRIYYDDITAEEVVSKFGRTEIFKQILENRYTSRATTLVSLNYNEDDRTIDGTLNLFGNRYGARVYDRVFEMFNIVTLTGKSLRK